MDSKEWIPAACVGTTTIFLLVSYLALIDCTKIPAQLLDKGLYGS
jgi:hypothetical protein